jgi:hypothetical protein
LSTRTKTLWLVFYGYGIEFVLAGVLSLLTWLLGLLPKALELIEVSALPAAAFFGVLLAAAFAAWLILFGFNAGEFGAWLEWKRLNGIFSGAFLFNALLFLIASIVAIFVSFRKDTWVTNAALYLFILGVINAVTLSLLIYRLSRLQGLFNFELTRETRRTAATESDARRL